MISIVVNDRTLPATEGETLLTVLRRHGITVPTLCHLAHLTPTGACRMCVVEVEGQRGLVPSCAFPVSDKMKIRTHSPRAVQARRTIVELLLSNHPDDCLYCVRNQDCELQSLARELVVQERRFKGARNRLRADVSGPSIVRDPEKCILCGKCVRVCEEIQGVGCIDFVGRGSKTTVGTAFDQGLNVSSCINCGQCVLVCPTGALTERDAIKEVWAALHDSSKTVVIQHAPAVSVTLGEEFGLKPGTDVAGTMTAALRRMGFRRVFDTSFAADLTVMEEASELADRLANNGVLPMLTSCSPGWIKFVEQEYPDLLPHLSSCKSPQQMLGAVIKTWFARQEGLDPEKIYSVSVMPCTAKKFEAGRPEMGREGVADVDAVLTTRELAALIRLHGLDLAGLEPDEGDSPFGERSTAGKLFGSTGGVMESALRTAHFLLTGRELENLKVQAARGLEGVKEVRLTVGEREVGAVVVSGLREARRLLEQIRGGRRDLHFIEVMTCPGGCINGGGQIRGLSPEAVRARMQALHQIDRNGTLRTAHSNPSVQRLYREFLGQPLSELSHRLLHTHYAARPVVR
jgi:iron-only hydrogenase group A